MPRGGTPNRTAGQQQRTRNSNGDINWGKNAKWAFFKHIPDSVGNQPGEPKHGGHGWVRVGSKLWGEIKYYNQHTAGKVYTQQTGAQTGLEKSTPKLIPTRKLTSAFRPGSTTFKATNGLTKNPGVDPGRGGEQGAKHSGKAGDVSPGGNKNPGNTNPPKGPKNPPNQLSTFGKAIGNPNSNKLEKLSSAQAIAGLQYDAQIHDAKLQIAENAAQGAQNVADINTWYKHLGNLNSDAQAQNKQDVNQQVQGNLNDMLAGLAAIGGSANASAGAVAARSIGGNDLARQLGVNADNFYNNQATALGQNQDAQKLAQQALNSQTDLNLHNSLQDLQGQRGQAVTAAQQAILAFNNAARQSNFGNRISKLQSMYGAQQLATNNVMSKAQLKQFQNSSPSSTGHIPFYKQTADQRQKTIAYLLQGGPVDAQGNPGPVSLAVAAHRAKLNGYDAAPGTVLWGILGTYTH